MRAKYVHKSANCENRKTEKSGWVQGTLAPKMEAQRGKCADASWSALRGKGKCARARKCESRKQSIIWFEPKDLFYGYGESDLGFYCYRCTVRRVGRNGAIAGSYTLAECLPGKDTGPPLRKLF